jgi:hypothetical protein
MSNKLSGAARRTFERIAKDPASPFSRLLRINKRGRPKGAVQKQLWRDLAWLGEPEWTDQQLLEALLSDAKRTSRGVNELGPCDYRDMKRQNLRRRISEIRLQVWGKRR